MKDLNFDFLYNCSFQSKWKPLMLSQRKFEFCGFWLVLRILQLILYYQTIQLIPSLRLNFRLASQPKNLQLHSVLEKKNLHWLLNPKLNFLWLVYLTSKSDVNFPILKESLCNSLGWIGFKWSGRRDSNLRPSTLKAWGGNIK